MHATILNVTFDSARPAVLARFWGEVTGWEVQEQDSTPGHEEYAVGPPSPGGPRLYFVQVPEHKAVKNRIHLDLIPPGDDQAAELARLVGLGASVLDGQPAEVPWVVLADPEGNEFCLEG
ncbi:MAG TPA: VOC family protein [Streptosporangiaceae bacterium]|nr:VOC family protein [Streptosporangiaceae bacterium]